KYLKLLEMTEKEHKLIEYIKESQLIFPEIEEFVGNYDTHKETIKKTFKELGKSIAKIDVKNIKNILSANLQTRTMLHEWLDDDQRILKDVEILISSNKSILPENIPEEQKYSFIENLRRRRKYFLNFVNMFTLAMITYPHAIYTRYPNDILSPHEYNKRLGIVSCYNKILKLLNKTIKWYGEDLKESQIWL
ncbi:unnamed protein product, partial [marine sediment metagenome]